MCEECVGGFRSAPQLNHWMVRSQIGKQNIESDRPHPLRGQLAHQPSVDVARPVETSAKIERAVLESIDALVANEHEAQIVRRRRNFGKRLPGPPVKSNPFQALEHAVRAKVMLRNRKQANQRDCGSDNGGRTGLCELEFQRSTPKRETRSNSQAAPG